MNGLAQWLMIAIVTAPLAGAIIGGVRLASKRTSSNVASMAASLGILGSSLAAVCLFAILKLALSIRIR